VDEHTLLLPLAADAREMPQHHCTAVLRGHRKINAVFSGCVATLHALLHVMCPDLADVGE
jgi:hypothetical protein